MNRTPPPPFFRLALLAASLMLCAASSPAADSRYWTLTPYNVRVQLAVESRMLPSKALAEQIAAHLRERADASIGALWNLTVEPLEGAARLKALRGYSDDERLAIAADPELDTDKLIVLRVSENLQGFVVSGVECDPLLERSTEPLSTEPCELHAAPEAAFGLLVDLFSPIAIFDIDRATGEDATLSFRGSQLPKPAGAPAGGRPGDVLLPVLRRTDREGEVVKDGVQVAPWTFLLMTDQGDPKIGPHAKIYSHTRKPFGVRRRGRTEYYALLLRRSSEPTHVHLHVRDKPGVPLSGYQAYVQDGDKDQRDLVGASDSDGMVAIPPGESPIQLVYIKSGSQVVAKAPAPVGAIRRIDIPLLDERKRLEAEAKLGLLREELIDLIARRSILAARIRNEIKSGNKDQARELLVKLDGMPGRAQFSQKLNRVQQQSKSDDPVVQQRIEQLFEDTAVVLGAFLGTGEVDQLRQEIEGG